ncbi:thiamine-phosphate kinase [Telmatospirillum siberiense]|uniref:Thiamine-monophosphate kinase n=1 Tax=Telmatospirillum siberiense TaxID=382514 RepID=A0A2N3PYV3_9PROT|nr:thiamine-phosphate kinase [Telmatospirillum siberiense]PKU25559.1 thiamine-phosphate kinase [Telmatospirillum siberiense]
MSGLDEFSLIARLFAPLAARHPGALGLTDDAALIDGPEGRQWAVTADAMVAGVHFLPDDPPDLIARKLIRVNLSDLAAMGARPFAVLLASCFPRDVTGDWLDRFASGLKTDCEEFSIALIGGDTVATPGPLTLALTAIGDVGRNSALLRSNARSGDDIWVSGTIGDSAFGLMVGRGEPVPVGPAERQWLLERYRLPRPRTTLGPALVGLAGAAMDISDGLVGDLGHICETSGVGAVIEAEKVPLSDAVRMAISAGFGSIVTVLTGGDDYELLFSAPAERATAIEALGRELDLRLTPIGRIIEGEGVRVEDSDGRALSLSGGGYRHFGG